jgi:membrane-associated phospholipid phosphatase
MLKIFARIVSIVFHPLLIISIFSFTYIREIYGYEIAKSVLILISLTAIIPIIVFNSIQLFRGKISNFDLSNNQERSKSYPKLLFILILLIADSVYYNFPIRLVYLLLTYSTMIFVFYLFRNKFKISLHSATAFFLAAVMLYDFLVIGLIALAVSAFVGLSRIILRRHTKMEVIIGSISGIILGLVAGLIH